MYFLYHTLIFVVLNSKVLANFSSGYPLTITRDFPVHNTFCWVFPIRDASLTCPGVTVLFKKIRGNLKNFAIQLGDQGGRGEECSQSPPSNLCVCVCAVNAWRWHSHNIHLEPGVCVYVNIWRWCNNLHLQLCMCAHVHAWRWHSDTATISILNCVCVLVSMLISTLKRAQVNAWRWHSHNLHLDP